jgi:hypothetical protein
MNPDENQDAFSLGIFVKGEEERGWRSVARKRKKLSWKEKNGREGDCLHSRLPVNQLFSTSFASPP